MERVGTYEGKLAVAVPGGPGWVEVHTLHWHSIHLCSSQHTDGLSLYIPCDILSQLSPPPPEAGPQQCCRGSHHLW